MGKLKGRGSSSSLTAHVGLYLQSIVRSKCRLFKFWMPPLRLVDGIFLLPFDRFRSAVVETMEIGHATKSQLSGTSIQHLDGKQKAGSFNVKNGMSDGTVIGPSPSFRLRNSGVETVRLRRIFDTFDENKDGKISIEELDRALQRLGVEVPVDGSHMETMGSSSFKGDGGGLEFEEFVDLHRSLGTQLWADRVGSPSGKEEEEDNELKEAFRVFDEDGDGCICAAELQCVLSRLGFAEESDIERCERMICGVDQNNDGLVDFSEFKHMMRNVIVRRS